MDIKECPLCHGEGVISPRDEDDGIVDRMCPLCDGEGEVYDEE